VTVPFWVIQSDLNAKAHLAEMAHTLRQIAVPFVGCQLTPFSNEIEYLFEPPPADAFVIPYGTTKLTALARKEGWAGLFYDEDTFCVDAWIRNRTDMLNQEVEIMSVATVEKRFAGYHDEDEHFFIRPVADLKAFTGCVVSARELASFSTSHHAGSAFGSGIHYAKEFTLDTACAVSPAQEIIGEWRFFIVGGEPVSGSAYRHHGRHIEHRVDMAHESIARTVRRLCDGWLPHQVCVMDIAHVKEDGVSKIKVIEFNAFNASGFYDHDVAAVARAVSAWAAKQ